VTMVWMERTVQLPRVADPLGTGLQAVCLREALPEQAGPLEPMSRLPGKRQRAVYASSFLAIGGICRILDTTSGIRRYLGGIVKLLHENHRRGALPR
jgi:hypothetical protein